jgi:hypothetical protein
VLIADTLNHAIRRYLPKEGKFVRVAGTGTGGKAGLDGDPLRAQLSCPTVSMSPATGRCSSPTVASATS